MFRTIRNLPSSLIVYLPNELARWVMVYLPNELARWVMVYLPNELARWVMVYLPNELARLVMVPNELVRLPSVLFKLAVRLFLTCKHFRFWSVPV